MNREPLDIRRWMALGAILAGLFIVGTNLYAELTRPSPHSSGVPTAAVLRPTDDTRLTTTAALRVYDANGQQLGWLASGSRYTITGQREGWTELSTDRGVVYVRTEVRP